MRFDFTGKTVLVTGGGVGIGRAIADGFDAAGARVVIAENSADRAAAVAAALPNARVVECDVRDRGAPARLAAAVGERLDVLVNNVGHFVQPAPFAQMDDALVDEVLDINLGQLLRMTRAMIPLLRAAAPGSSIVNVTSIEAYRGIPNCAVYAAAKAGIAGFTKSLALELAPEGVRVNDVAPETTDTPQVALDYMIPAENRPHADRTIPLGRFGRPQDVAGAAMFLASPLAEWITGSAIHVDGGALAASGWTRAPDGQWTVVPMVAGNALVFPKE